MTTAAVHRYPMFLAEEDWAVFREAVAAAYRRARSQPTRDALDRIDQALTGAAADAEPDGDELRYVIHLEEAAFKRLVDAVDRQLRKRGKDQVQRITSEIRMAYADSTPVGDD
ncbi:hypothetical protein SMD44_07356 [Streptomyces alboflavus]|uniref:Uncharacterized protein n=1 Tax=Streptomyces alboflavus TaxID=67267 RepID=A0A1Z1WN43_9ACTN|nr:hypothetical protein [Streptomyces alboflavus]ARX87874.1 hypothetical protein SMD44_07356 [Streptomyces alboflavus]